MKRLLALALGVCCVSPWLHAGPNEMAIIAAMRLSDQANYSWTATVSDDARTYDIEGRTIRGGFTRVKMPVIAAVRRKLGRSVTDTQIELIFRGNVACVVETETGWARPGDLPEPVPDDYENGHLPNATGHAPIVRAKGGSISRVPGAGGLPGSRRPMERPTAYSNLQLAISHPHEELAVIVSGHTHFKVEDDIATGTLTELAAQLLLVRDGQSEISQLRAEGSFKLWLHGGMVTKYQVQLHGALSVQSRGSRREIVVQQSTVTQIKNVGRTSFDVPDEARLKLMP